jgi:hypothetical protein
LALISIGKPDLAEDFKSTGQLPAAIASSIAVNRNKNIHMLPLVQQAHHRTGPLQFRWAGFFVKNSPAGQGCKILTDHD